MKTVKKTNFFTIEQSWLGDDVQVLPFSLYILDTQSERHTVFLHAGSPYVYDAQEQLKVIIEKGGVLEISLKDKDLFLSYTGISEEFVPSLTKVKNEWDTLLETRQQKFKEEQLLEFSFVDAFRRAVIANYFTPIIERARAEILLFPFDHSSTISNATLVADELLKRDDFTARVIACSYFVALKMKYDDEETLAAVICAAAFRDMGQTQLNPKILQNLTDLAEDQYNMWSKHPALSAFVLKKSGTTLSERCMRIILEHHERFDGRGFPHGKKVDFIDPLAEVVGLFDHAFRFSYGYITGNPTPIMRTFKSILGQVNQDGLEVNFSPGLLHLIDSYLPNLPDDKPTAVEI